MKVGENVFAIDVMREHHVIFGNTREDHNLAGVKGGTLVDVEVRGH